jgi:hypothetical protein
MTSHSSRSDDAETACEARFLARAKYADERASGPGDGEVRQTWMAIAAGYRELAALVARGRS